MNKYYLRKNCLFAFFVFCLGGCLGVDESDFVKEAEPAKITYEEVPQVTGFEGITSVTNITASTALVSWSSFSGAAGYLVTNLTNGSFYKVEAASKTSLTVQGLEPSTTYKFLVRVINEAGDADINNNTIEFTTGTGPLTPSALTLVTPSTNRSFQRRPVFQVSGVDNGYTVRLYVDSSCTMQVGQATATTTSVNITTDYLPARTYTFYADAEDTNSDTSPCSEVSFTYTIEACPDGYIPAPEDTSLNVDSFCVMKFEAKNDTGVAASNPSGLPWVNINLTDAYAACNALGTRYDLISNPEWMAMARDIEAQGENWSSSFVGNGMINTGHSDNVPPSALTVLTTTDEYSGTGNNALEAAGAGWEQRRTHYLSNGEIVWDFSGNLWEWADWSLGGGLNTGPVSCAGVTDELFNIACAALSANDYLPGNPAGVPTASYDSTYGLGRFRGGAGGGTLRSGAWGFSPTTGIYALWLDDPPTGTWPNTGFRCVYRLN